MHRSTTSSATSRTSSSSAYRTHSQNDIASMRAGRNLHPCAACAQKKTKCVIVNEAPRLCESCKRAGEPQCPIHVPWQTVREMVGVTSQMHSVSTQRGQMSGFEPTSPMPYGFDIPASPGGMYSLGQGVPLDFAQQTPNGHQYSVPSTNLRHLDSSTLSPSSSSWGMSAGLADPGSSQFGLGLVSADGLSPQAYSGNTYASLPPQGSHHSRGTSGNANMHGMLPSSGHVSAYELAYPRNSAGYAPFPSPTSSATPTSPVPHSQSYVYSGSQSNLSRSPTAYPPQYWSGAM